MFLATPNRMAQQTSFFFRPVHARFQRMLLFCCIVVLIRTCPRLIFSPVAFCFVITGGLSAWLFSHEAQRRLLL